MNTPALAAQPEQLMEQFVFHSDPYDADKIPRGLNAEHVVKFTEQQVKKEISLQALHQLEKLVEHYDVYEASEHLKALLKSLLTEPESLNKAIVITRILAKSPQPEDQALAERLYPNLAGKADDVATIDELIALFAELPQASPDPVRRRIQRKIAKLQTPPQSHAARLQMLELEEQSVLALQRAEAAAEIKRKTLAMEDRTARIAEEVKMYLTIKYGYLEYLQPWAAHRLRRETWAKDPAQQQSRVIDDQKRAELIGLFRKAVALLDTSSSLTPEEIKFIRLRGLRAIEFFGEPLPMDELQWLHLEAGAQLDVLSHH